MSKRIVLPLYDHATPAEIAELLSELNRLGLALAPVYEERVGSGWYETPVHGADDLDQLKAEQHVCPDCGGETFWSVEAQDWLHEASDASCFLARREV